jgi:hypothetical protein
MIRHASPSGPITAISGGMHDATARSCLIASPSFPLSVASGFLRAGSDAVDLTSIAPPADKDLRAAASTQKHSARCFVGRMRHTDPQLRRRFRLLQPPDPIKHAAVLEAVKARPRNVGVCLPGGATADLDSFCARRRRKSAVGAEESLRRGRTKERARASKKVSEKKYQQERKCLRSGWRLENEGTASWHEQRNCTDKEPAMI